MNNLQSKRFRRCGILLLMVSAIALSTMPSLAVHSTTPAILAQTSLPTQLAQAPQTGYPQRTAPVINDFAQVLTPTEADKIRHVLEELKVTHGIEVVVVTIDAVQKYETSDPSFERFATNLFNTWGIGDAERDDGVLMLLSIRDRAVRIELGAGYSSRYDAVMQRIIDQSMLPQFKNGQYGEGLYQGSRALAQQLTTNSSQRVLTIPEIRIPTLSEIKSKLTYFQQSISEHIQPLSWKYRLYYGLLFFLSLFAIGYFIVKIIRLIFKQVRALIRCFKPYLPRLWRYRGRKCPNCQIAMVRLSRPETEKYLDPGQKLEQQLEPAEYDCWQCSSCNHHQVIRYQNLVPVFTYCPSCHYQLLQSDKGISQGRLVIKQHCQHCDYQHEKTVTSRSRRRRSSSRSSSGRSSGGGSSRGGGASGRW